MLEDFLFDIRYVIFIKEMSLRRCVCGVLCGELCDVVDVGWV